tara:strand:- start:1174 stop:1377 length:204 start_codon:yes stop_codon:yes gene_type:complete
MGFLTPSDRQAERDSLNKDVERFLDLGGVITVLDMDASRGDLSPKEMSISSAIRYKRNKIGGAYGKA